jgi:ABC-type sugar transport system permease subunit
MTSRRSGSAQVAVRARRFESREVGLAYGLLVPGLLVLGGVLAYPLGYAFWLSLNDVDANLHPTRFVWLHNYNAAIHDPSFLPSLERTLYFAGLTLVGTVGLGFAIGLLLTTEFRGRAIVRGLMVVPWAVSATVVALTFGWIFNSQLGTLNGLLEQLHLIRYPVVWFDTSGWQTLSLMALATVWATAPFAGLLYLGALQTVPEELQRAARVDGAGPLRRFFTVTVPWVRRTTFLVCVLAVISGFTAFVLVLIMTGGGPGEATNILPWWAYTIAFTNFDWGEGSAIFFLIALSVFAISGVLYLLLGRRADD